MHTPLRIILRRIFTGLAVIFVVGYGLYQSRLFLAGPILIVTAPADGSLVEESPVTVSGTARYISFLEFNGRQTYVDEHNRFREPVLLHPGYNVVTVRVRDRFGREKTEQLELVHRPDDSTAPPPDISATHSTSTPDSTDISATSTDEHTATGTPAADSTDSTTTDESDAL